MTTANAAGEGKPAGTTTPENPAKPAEGASASGPSPADVDARVAAAVEAERRKLLKDLGVDKVEDAQAALRAKKEREDAEKSELERVKGRVDELAPKAKRAETLEATLKQYLDAEEAAIPKEKRDLLELAPPAEQLEARLAWLTSAKKKNLFATEAPKAEKTEKPAEKPANSRAGGAPPAPGGTPAKRPAEMTEAEFRAWKSQRDAQRRGGAA